MAKTEAQMLKQAGKLFRKTVYNSKVPVKTLRSQYDALLGTTVLPNNIDIHEVQTGVVLSDLLTPELAIGKRIILYAHGGGFIAGSRKASRSLCASLANECATRLLLPEYRLAPEYPFPTPLEDLYNAYAWILHNKTSPKEIILAGDGAGASLAISLLHYLQEKNVPLPAAVIALSPWVDLSCDSSIFHLRKNPDPIHTREILAGQALQYTWQSNFRNPHVSPIHGDFTSAPPFYIQVGSSEILLDDAKRLTEAVRMAGGSAKLDIETGMWHLFQSIDTLTPKAHLAVRRIGSWVRSGCAGGLF